jgi:hypothetical protein
MKVLISLDSQKFFGKYRRSMKVLRIGIGLLIISKIPIIFIGFSQHHDGLMLATVRNLSYAFEHHSAWPFNQYGSFWIFPYFFFSKLFPPAFTLISMRLLTFAIYCLALILIHKIGLKYKWAYASEFAISNLIFSEPSYWPRGSSLAFFNNFFIASFDCLAHDGEDDIPQGPVPFLNTWNNHIWLPLLTITNWDFVFFAYFNYSLY